MNHNLERLPPTQMREILGVLISSNGSANTQLTLYIEKISIFTGKPYNCHISNCLPWKAIKMILEPGILYPLMATIYDLKELKLLETKLAQLYCHALDLYIHFPQAVLYGPAEVGGLDIASLQAMLTTIHLNCFLYHTKQQTHIRS